MKNSYQVEELSKISSDQADVKAQSLSQCLDLIMAPSSLQALFLVLNNLKEILPVAIEVSDRDSQNGEVKETLLAAHTTVIQILEIEDIVKKSPILDLLFPIEGSRAEDNFEGYLESYPLYSLLGHSIFLVEDNSDLKRKYRHLQAQFFLACQKMRGREDFQKLLTAFRGARYLSERKYRALLIQLPSASLAPDQYLSLLSGEKKNRLADTRVFLEMASQVNESPREKKVNARKSASASCSSSDEDETNQEQIWVGESRLSESTMSPDMAHQYQEWGGHPKEFPKPFDLIPVVASEERIYSRSTMRELAFQAKSRSNRIAMNNQLNPLAWQELNEYDVVVLLKFLSDGVVDTDLGTHELNNVRLLLSFIFWFCCSLERALSLKLSASSSPSFNDTDCIYWGDGQNPYLRLYSPGPPLCSESRRRDFPLAQPIVYYTEIPLGSSVQKVISSTLAFRPDPTSLGEREIFQGMEVDDVNNDIRLILRSLNQECGTRLSIGRISLHLLRSLARYPGEDLPSAMLFLGHDDRLAVTRMHYTCASLPKLKKSYRTLCNQQAKALKLNVEFEKSRFGTDGAAVNLGTSWCPREETVQELVSGLLDNIETFRLEKGDLDLIAEFHKHFTLYTALYLAFATGYRAVQDPSFKAKDIDRNTGLAVISDKDDDFHYSSRLVWLSDDCLRQIDYYGEHLQALWDTYGLTSEPLFSLYQTHAGIELPLNLVLVNYHFNEGEALRPSLTKTFLEDLYGYDLPPNANRHYLKYQLQKSGCPSDIVENLLGHWELGQEPWVRFSNLSPVTYRDILKTHLEPILERDGWRPVEGFSG